MLIWDTGIDLCQAFSGDSSSGTLTTFKSLMNLGYKEILHTFDGEETEDVRTWSPTAANITAGVRAFKLPPNYIRMHTVTATIGNQVYPVLPEESQDKWAQRLFSNRTSSRPTNYFIRPRFGVSGTEILFDPKPSSTDLTITINYAANSRDLAVDEYTTGTVTATNASTTITGSGTTFATEMIGRYFKVNDATGDGNWYRITAYTSATSITLENYYDGTTVTGKDYKVAEAFNLPEDLQMAPVEYAMWYYYLGVRKDPKQAKEWGDKYLITKRLAEQNYQKKNKNAHITSNSNYSIFPVATPSFWPDHVTDA